MHALGDAAAERVAAAVAAETPSDSAADAVVWSTPRAASQPVTFEPAAASTPAALPIERTVERPPAPAATVAAPRAAIEWERLFGVRAAAVLGGIALALAGLLFFKYSIEHGLIPPWLRVVVGTVVGIACVVGGELTLRHRYAGTADALAGGGLVVLYAAFWAASIRYALVPVPVGYLLMIAVTGTGCVLAARHAALATAVIGLAGGFATPLLLSSGADRPIGLFGYVLLLDLALLYLAQRRRWMVLSALSLAGTLFYQLLWIGERMGSARLGVGLTILGVFALVFAAASTVGGSEQQRGARWTSAAAVLFPFAFAIYFAVAADFPASLNPVATLILLLSLASGWLARRQGPPALASGAAAAGLGVLAMWTAARGVDGGHAWQLIVWASAISAVFHLFVERAPASAALDGPAPPALLAAGGYFVLTIAASLEGDSLAPWLVGWALLAALLIRHASFPDRAALQVAAALAVGFSLTVLRNAHAQDAWFPAASVFLLLPLAAALAFQGVALSRRNDETRRWAEHAAAALPVLLLLYMLPQRAAESTPPLLVATSALGVLAACAATRLGAGGWMLAAVGATAMAHDEWSRLLLSAAGQGVAPRSVGLAVQSLAVVCFTLWPLASRQRWRRDRLIWPAAALAGPAWFLSLRRLFEAQAGDSAIGLLPVALGALVLLVLLRIRDLWPQDDAMRTEVLAELGAVVLGFATVAIPLQVAREWITIGWALEGFAVLMLWRRLDHPGLKYAGVALLAASAVRLVANPSILSYYPRPNWRVLNWLLYAYLVPAAAQFGGSSILSVHELARLRAWERRTIYERAKPWGAVIVGIAGLTVIFAWINLAIADWFGSGDALVVSFERLPARDLTTSIAWAAYALLLLVLGVVRRSVGLRWASLALLLVTIAKVFLYDLGELRDLYRVASLFGLAISLILVSLAYQRFVFRSDLEDAP